MNGNYLKINELRINNYKIFNGDNSIVFNERMTIITGNIGSGKTTIFEALKHINRNRAAQPALGIAYEGDINLIDRFGPLIFMDSAPGFTEQDYSIYIDENTRVEEIKTEARKIFSRIVTSKTKYGDDINTELLPGGETICFRFSYTQALRQKIGLNVPLIMVSPFARLDEYLFRGLYGFIGEQRMQIIIICSIDELRGIVQPDYLIKRIGEHSVIEKNG